MSHTINQEAQNFATKTTSMRLWFAFFAVIIWMGISFTGFSNVHWFLYIPASGLVFAAITGICPSLVAINKLVGAK